MYQNERLHVYASGSGLTVEAGGEALKSEQLLRLFSKFASLGYDRDITGAWLIKGVNTLTRSRSTSLRKAPLALPLESM